MDLLDGVSVKTSNHHITKSNAPTTGQIKASRPTVLHIITGLSDGGAETALLALVSHDSASEHVAISLTDEGIYGARLRAQGVSVITLDMPSGMVTVRGLFKLFRSVRDINPDVVQTWMYHADLLGGIMARLARVPKISWNIRHSFLMPGVSSPKTILISKINAMLSKVIPHRIVCCAEKALEVHADIGYQRQRMLVIPNGYDTSVFFPDQSKREATRRELGIAENVPLMGFVARYDPLKDHATLIQALERVKNTIPEAHTVLVGADVDHQNEELVAALKAAGLEGAVTLIGRSEDVPGIMNALDVHVMSSSSEAFPNVLAEAMACGTPCVSTDVGDARMIVGDTGWIVPPKDPQKLADAVIEALREHQAGMWDERRKRATERILDNFQIQTMVNRYRTEAWDLPESAS